MKRYGVLVSCLAVLILLVGGCQTSRPTPPAPKPLAPANGSQVTSVAVVLKVEAGTAIEQYRWTVKDPAAGTIVAQGTTVDPNWTVTRGALTNMMEYSWTCAARNARGWGKEFAPEWTFKYEVPAPKAPVPVAPADGAEVPTLTPTLSVQSLADVDEYEWVVKDSTGARVAGGVTPDPSWTVNPDLRDKMKYTWSCTAKNLAGTGLASAEWSFRVKLPPPPKPAAAPLTTIHFDFDKYDIRAGDASILEGNATWLRSNSGVNLVLEGYCDPSGTEEYNRGLGMRRARATKDYLVKLGIDAGRLSLLSFGKENLVTTDEASYEMNRRVEFKSK